MSESSTDTPADNVPEKRDGTDLIRDFCTRLPGKPGVYRMYDAKGAVLYVGKARNLKNRVSNYARGQGHNNRIALMISLTAHMEFVTTASEAEALLLESNLIKKLKPRFNVILRDDKSFPYILIAKDHPVPQLVKHRGARNRRGSYYGPFASAGAVNAAINTLQKAFLIRTCTDATYANRNRPCLLHQIKRCAAPCVNYITPEDYAGLVAEAETFLSKGGGPVKAELARRMEDASNALDFETAARFRDRIQAMSFVTQSQGINPQGVDEADLFALAQEGGQTCVQVFFFRSGQNWGNRAYFPRTDKFTTDAELLAAFLGQFYDDKPLPPLILLSHEVAERELLEEAFTAHAGHKVEILVPQRGEKKMLVDHAVTNAREANGRKLAESSSQEKLLEGVAKAFGLEAAPRRIEDESGVLGRFRADVNGVQARAVEDRGGVAGDRFRPGERGERLGAR
ncbi:MAG: excinuclease ABC subunit C, partial [Phyllobacteriaceae bacterium]|nr:excinuclease ABC subunit C [Phyllobacteriaceae bacterium]